MIEESYVSYEQCLILEKLRFRFDAYTSIYNMRTNEGRRYDVPTTSFALRWLRELKGWKIGIEPQSGDKFTSSGLIVIDGSYKTLNVREWTDTYHEAELKVLELILNWYKKN